MKHSEIKWAVRIGGPNNCYFCLADNLLGPQLFDNRRDAVEHRKKWHKAQGAKTIRVKVTEL